MQALTKSSTLAVVVTLCVGTSALAQSSSKAGGLSRALSKVGTNGGGAAGLSRASQKLSQAGGNLSRGGLGKASALSLGGRSTRTTHKIGSPKAADATTAGDQSQADHTQQLTIEQRNRDTRIAQAQRLRDMATRNGNANLAANADRMETFANQHYQERVEHLQRFGVLPPELDPSQPAGTSAPLTDGPPLTAPAVP